MECIICIEDISENTNITLECCKKDVHLKCLNEWVTTNINLNKKVNKCFFCNQKNDIIEFMGNDLNRVITLQDNLIDENNMNIIPYNVREMNNEENSIDIININTAYKKILLVLLYFLFFIVLFYLLIN